MTGTDFHRFSFTARPPATSVDRTGRRLISTANFHANQQRILNLTTPYQPRSWSWDLLTFARAAFLADRAALREYSRDRWTRTIELSVPVLRQELWDDVVRDTATALLSTLTGDRWILEFRDADQMPPWAAPTLDDPADGPDDVALFSGGLDSTAAAAKAVADGQHVLLVTYERGKLKAIQDDLVCVLKRLGEPNQVQRAPRVSLDVRGFGDKTEQSSRSRGLLYIATAVHQAAARGARKVVVPENGQLAINPPLSAGRLTACSTRSVHPRTLNLINRLIARLGGDVDIVNPLLCFTKGDVCRIALKAGLERETLYRGTISCGQPPMYRGRSPHAHCGRCVACLLRRSGLLAGTGADQTEYQRELGEIVNDDERGIDYWALRRWLTVPFGAPELAKDVPLPSDAPVARILWVLESGRQELRSMVRQLTPDAMPSEGFTQLAA